MLKVTDYINALIYLATKRVTYYDNSFPGNCGEINPDGSISFDCINLIKSIINEPGIAYKTSPAGYYVKPGQVIPDTNEIGILNLCSGVAWDDFQNMVPGEYLYMAGHGGTYIGDHGDVNVIECTAAWRGGVLCSWVDPDGTRRSCKGGGICGRWEAHGKMSRYIDYSAQPQPKPTPGGKSVSCLAFDCVQQEWLPIVTSQNYAVDTIGNPYHALGGFAVHCADQGIRYAAHDCGGNWLPEVSGYNVNNFDQGFAGNYVPVDCVIIFGKGIAYQAKVKDTQEWLPVVYSDNANYGDVVNGFAGNPGQVIDELKIWRV